MAITVENPASEGKIRGWFRQPFRNSPATSSSSSNNHNDDGRRRRNNLTADESNAHHSFNSSSSILSAAARFLLPSWRRLKLDPSHTLYFQYEPGKQVQSAITIKNTSKSHVAFKFQTTAPKSCFMRPPGAILAPGESIIATVFRFVEHAETHEGSIEHKSMVKYRIMSMKVKGPTEYTQEMFDEQKDQARVEKILRVVFLDTESTSPALEKLKRQLAEAALQDSKKPPAYEGPSIIRKELVVDEWKKRRDIYLARQQSEGLDSV